MTREEARVFSYEVGNGDDATVDEIYDDFNSRTCENCSYFDRIGACSNKESAVYDKLVWDDFGCLGFERKESDNSLISKYTQNPMYK